MPRLDDRFINCFQMLASATAPDFRTMIKIGLNLIDAFASLPGEGLCYRDVSFGNLFVDPGTGDVAIIDNDNVGTTGEETYIKGTLQFMAPEVMLDEATPRTESDLYSLALFLFYLFCHGHPLEGSAPRLDRGPAFIPQPAGLGEQATVIPGGPLGGTAPSGGSGPQFATGPQPGADQQLTRTQFAEPQFAGPQFAGPQFASPPPFAGQPIPYGQWLAGGRLDRLADPRVRLAELRQPDGRL
jgi:serine/threonine protein kinase